MRRSCLLNNFIPAYVSAFSPSLESREVESNSRSSPPKLHSTLQKLHLFYTFKIFAVFAEWSLRGLLLKFYSTFLDSRQGDNDEIKAGIELFKSWPRVSTGIQLHQINY